MADDVNPDENKRVVRKLSLSDRLRGKTIVEVPRAPKKVAEIYDIYGLTRESQKQAEEQKGKRDAKDTESIITRINPASLELAYIREPIMFAGITNNVKAIQEIFNLGLLEYSTDEARVEVARLFRETNLYETLFEKSPLHLQIDGNGWINFVRDSKTESIIDFVAADFKYMDIKRKNGTYGPPDLDDRGNPKSYIQRYQGTEKPISIKNMIHLHINQINRGERGIGLVEPVYTDITLKENVEQAKGQVAYKVGFPVPLIEFGSDSHPPTSAMKAQAEALARTLANENTVCAAYPYYFRINWLNSGAAEAAASDFLYYSTKLQAAVLGCPIQYLTQGIEGGGGKSDLATLVEFYELHINWLFRAIRAKDIINFVLKENGIDGEITKFPWKELTQKSAKEKVMRVSRLAKVDMLPRTDAMKNHLAKDAGVPQDVIDDGNGEVEGVQNDPVAG